MTFKLSFTKVDNTTLSEVFSCFCKIKRSVNGFMFDMFSQLNYSTNYSLKQEKEMIIIFSPIKPFSAVHPIDRTRSINYVLIKDKHLIFGSCLTSDSYNKESLQ